MAAEGPGKPGAEADDLSRFLIRSPTQIRQILAAIAEHHEIVTAYFNRGRQFLLTAIVDVDVVGKRIVLDRGSDEAVNARLLESDRVVLVSAHEKVKVQFSVKQVRAIEHDGRPAFSIALPAELLKLQRRECFRVRTSASEPVRVRLPIGEPGNMLELQALDISIGGLAAFVSLPASRAEVGNRFPGASLQIGTGSSFTVELELRSLNSVRLRNGTDSTRAGFMFVDLPESAQQQIQRYLMRVERERRNREAAFKR
ncbi:MAG: flagellar brake protein [bacterium]|jgi:c-di-GMP-binding flagellar brake protein YcgR|nr:flagellar brake protein [Betaproteobacteria bacterium]